MNMAITAFWVIGRYKGDEAQRIRAEANEGHYQVLTENGKGKEYRLEVGFRLAQPDCSELKSSMAWTENLRLANYNEHLKFEKAFGKKASQKKHEIQEV